MFAAALTLIALVMIPGADTSHVLLWNNLYAGMTRAQAETLYPKLRTELNPGCPIELIKRFRQSKLVTVVLVDKSKSPACFEKLMAETIRQNGPGETKSTKQITGSGLMPVGYTYGVKNVSWTTSQKRICYTSSGLNASGNFYFSIDTTKRFAC